jgi:hypothetical protein
MDTVELNKMIEEIIDEWICECTENFFNFECETEKKEIK